MPQPHEHSATPAAAPAEPAPAAAIAAEAAADQTHYEQLAADAATVRGPDYDGTLSTQTLIALDALLRRPTPGKYVKHVPATDGKPYPSTGINSPQVQIDHMNAVLGTPHWRILAHYEDDGYVCKIVVIVGNRLGSATLDDGGELDAGDADVLAVRDGWGGVKRGNHKGDVLKGSETNALKRALARFGPGGDVYRLDFDSENVGGTGAHEYQPAGDRSGGVGSPGRRRGAITEAQGRRVWALNPPVAIGDRLNAVLHGTGRAVGQFAGDDDARRQLTALVPTIDRRQLDAVFALIEAGGVAPQDPRTGQTLPSIASPADPAGPPPAPDPVTLPPAARQSPPPGDVRYHGPSPGDAPVHYGGVPAA